MKKFTFLLILFLMACGAHKTNRIVPTVAAPEAKEVEASEAKEARNVRYVNAFSIDDLYKSRERKLKKPVKKTVLKEENELPEVIVVPKGLIEIIQVVDEQGNVIAAKQVK